MEESNCEDMFFYALAVNTGLSDISLRNANEECPHCGFHSFTINYLYVESFRWSVKSFNFLINTGTESCD